MGHFRKKIWQTENCFVQPRLEVIFFIIIMRDNVKQSYSILTLFRLGFFGQSVTEGGGGSPRTPPLSYSVIFCHILIFQCFLLFFHLDT